MEAIILEQGNGFPAAGRYVSSGDQLYRVVELSGPIHTDGTRGNYVYAEVEEADWDDCDESDVFPAGIDTDAE